MVPTRRDETESGQEANARDQQSFKGAFTNPKHNEVSLYPTVDEQIHNAAHKYGGVENLGPYRIQTVGFWGTTPIASTAFVGSPLTPW